MGEGVRQRVEAGEHGFALHPADLVQFEVAPEEAAAEPLRVRERPRERALRLAEPLCEGAEPIRRPGRRGRNVLEPERDGTVTPLEGAEQLRRAQAVQALQ